MAATPQALGEAIERGATEFRMHPATWRAWNAALFWDEDQTAPVFPGALELVARPQIFSIPVVLDDQVLIGRVEVLR